MTPRDRRNTATYTLIQVLCIVVMFMVVGYAAWMKMADDFWPLFQWWAATIMLGIACYPLSAMIFRRFDDRGYLFSKAIGLVVTAWVMWLSASLHILPFSTQNCYLCIGVCAACNYFGALIYRIHQGKKAEAKAHKAEKIARKAQKREEAAKAIRAEAEKIRAEAEEVKAQARAAQAGAEAAKAEAKTAKEKKKASQAEAEATKAAVEAAKAEARAVKAEAEALKAEAEARASEAEVKAIKAEAEAIEAEKDAAEAEEEPKAADTETAAWTSDEEAEGALPEKSADTAVLTQNSGRASQLQEFEDEKPFVIQNVPVKILNVKPTRVKEVRFRTSMAPVKETHAEGAGLFGAQAEALRADKRTETGTQLEAGTTAGTQSDAEPEKEKALKAKHAVRPHWERILCLELVFFILLTAFMYMKGFNPKAYGTEKMMDYGFMTSMFKTEYFPVEDFWFAGENLNYYYFGQYVMTFLTKVSFTTVSYGYNLALGTGFAFCATLVYSLVCQIMKVFAAGRKKRISGAVSHIAGALAAVAVTIAGNGHYIVFNKLVPMLWDILQIPGEKPGYWFPNSTRYIGYIPDTHDKTIHEFPSYSFILGDLHAHVVNITFVLTLAAVLFSFLMSRRETMRAAVNKRRDGEKTTVSIAKETFRLPVIAVGYLIGIFMMSNYWDFPIYFVVAGAVILTSNAVICGFDKRTWLLTALHAVVVLAVAFLTAMPFHMNFVAMANGILPAQTHTPLYQLIILWGIQVVIVIGFVTALIWKEIQINRKGKSEGAESFKEAETAKESGTADESRAVCEKKSEQENIAADKNRAPVRQRRFVQFLENLEISDLFILILGLCAVGLVLTPEVIYMSDIYAGDYKRSNTMFKLVYQAYILFGISIGYILTRFILLRETRRQLKWGVAGLVLLLWTCGYFGTSVRAWFGDLSNEEGYKGMRADRYIYEEQPTDAAAIAWLNDNVQGRPVILEANGESYTINNRVSVLTGMPTVLGWRVHEWLWHNSPEPVSARAGDVDTIYVSQDQELVRSLLDKYQVTYLFIGTCEYDKYMQAGMNTEMLRQMGEVVYEGYPDMQGRTVMIVKVR